jgi:chromosome partitioning protein
MPLTPDAFLHSAWGYLIHGALRIPARLWYMSPMITIAIANQKGGVGKTTTAINLSAALSRQDYRVLLVDMDAQAGATQNCLDAFGEAGAVVYDVLVKQVPVAKIARELDAGFDLAPSDLTLAGLDRALAGKANADGRLRTALGELRRRYDFVLVDCPGWLGMATLNAFVAADYVLMPVDCKTQSLETVNRLYEEIREVANAYRRPIGTLALPTFYERRLNLANEILEATRERFEGATLSAVNKSTALAEAYGHRKTIFDYDLNSPGAMDYLRVAKEIVDVTKPQRAGTGSGARTAEE